MSVVGGGGGEVENDDDDDVSSYSRSWSYRGEGSHNLVIAHKRERMVYRLLKRKTFSNHSFYVNKQQSDAELRSRLEKNNNFLEYVIRPLLGPHFTPPLPQIVEVPLSLLDEMKGAIRYKYPGCEQDCPLALQMTDSCFVPDSPGTNIPAFCFEIRPNLLLMAKGDAVEQQSPIKKLICRHCFTHAAKVKTGVWSDMCNSCPMELVSGDPARTKAALMKLLASPHNRLKIFKDGDVIFSQKCHNPQELVKTLQPYFSRSGLANNGQPAGHRTMDNVFELVTKCLLHSPPDSLANGDVQCSESGSPLLAPSAATTCEETMCIVSRATRQGEGVSSSLPKGCVLECVRNMQYLGQMDIEGIQQYYKRLEQNQINVMDDYHDADWSNIVGGRTCGEDDGSLEYARQKVKEFLVYLTMKSASIMVTLQPHFHPAAAAGSQGISSSHAHRANNSNPIGSSNVHQANSANPIGAHHVQQANGIDAPHVQQANVGNSAGSPRVQQANAGNNSVICDDEGRSFNFNVTVLDLDPKPVQKIPTSLRQNNKYIDIFMKEYYSDDSNLIDFPTIQNH